MNNVIELSENSVQILDRSNLTETSIVVVKVDVSSMPAHRAQIFMQDIATAFREKMAPAEVMVVPLTFDIAVYEREAQ